MKHMMKTLVIGTALTAMLTGCSKEMNEVADDEIPQSVLAQIKQHGFGTKNVAKADGGYLVEGDIILTQEFLDSKPGGNLLAIANTEHYRTTNLVSGSRTITMSLHSKLASKPGYPAALQEVANRYNAENLEIKFQVVSSNGDIEFINGNGPYLASAGFPTSSGDPYGTVTVYSRNIGTGTSSTFINYLATILTHEVGHCIGFRHTDYMDRSYSCGGAYSNEGASSVGAIHIPGTPTIADANSFMLACIGSNQNRPFTANDKTALTYIY